MLSGSAVLTSSREVLENLTISLECDIITYHMLYMR